jgi:TolB protein
LLLRVAAAIIIASTALVSVSLVFGEALPDSGQILYDVFLRDNVDVFTLDITRGITFNLTRHPSIDTQGTWSPDGRYIAFQSRRDGARWIYVMDANGRNAHALVPDKKIGQFNPVWSDDSRRIFFRTHPGRNAPIYRVNIDGSDLQRLNLEEYIDLLTPRFDPSRFMVMSYRDGNWGIFIYNSNWDDMRQLTNNNVLFRESPQWSTDDRQIAFVSLERLQTEIYVMNSDGSDFRQVTCDSMRKSNLSWRPTGS